jgi:hypothetical protein
LDAEGLEVSVLGVVAAALSRAHGLGIVASEVVGTERRGVDSRMSIVWWAEPGGSGQLAFAAAVRYL